MLPFRFTLLKRTIALLLVVTLFSFPSVEKAEALSLGGLLGGGGGDLVKDIGNTIQNTLQALSLQSLEQKELFIDGMYFQLAQKALQEMTGDIIKWLNSGLDGNPAFVTDIALYLQEAGDTAAADFIYGDEFSTLCPSFEANVREALADQYADENYGGFKKEAECTIDDAGVDDGAFLAGDFSVGGWDAWLEVVFDADNTELGATLSGKAVLNERSQGARDIAKVEADWGRGVLSKKSCTTVGTGVGAQERCIITTPGAIMQELATKALGTGIDSLLNADEANEVIGLLFGNLAKEAMTGVNGLLGLGGNAQYSNNTFGSGGNLSYLAAISQQQASTGGGSTIGGNKIEQALATETKVLELQLAIVDTISSTTRFFATNNAPYAGSSCWDLTIPTTLSSTLTSISAKLPQTISTVITLQDMASEFASTTSSAGQLKILEQLSILQSQGVLSGQTALVEYDFFLNSELKPFVVDFKKAILAEVQGCL